MKPKDEGCYQPIIFNDVDSIQMHLIHTVGPVCGGEWSDELREKLFKALMAPLKKAEDLKVNSIAFPAVSAGIYGCPLENVVN